jgi:hypothetical protein
MKAIRVRVENGRILRRGSPTARSISASRIPMTT